MKEETIKLLQLQLAILEKAHDKIFITQGYSHEVERIRILKEMVSEQLQVRGKNEDIDHSACSLR